MSAEQLTIAMMRIVIDKSIDHAKPHLATTGGDTHPIGLLAF